MKILSASNGACKFYGASFFVTYKCLCGYKIHFEDNNGSQKCPICGKKMKMISSSKNEGK